MNPQLLNTPLTGSGHVFPWAGSRASVASCTKTECWLAGPGRVLLIGTPGGLRGKDVPCVR